MAPHCRIWRSDLLRGVAVLALGAGIGSWCVRASAAPVTQPDVATTEEDTPIEVRVLENDFDDACSGPPCRPTLVNIGQVTQPANGTVSIDRNPGRRPDTVTYTPRSNFFGPDTFTYTAFDFSGVESSPTTVTITVTPVNDAPNAVDDAATTKEDSAVTIAVLANDTDIEGDALSVTSLIQPAHGTATLAGDAVTYTPNADFNGTDQFTYRAQDASATSSPATVTITVTPVNDAPNAVNDAATTKEGNAVTIAVLANDTDVDGDVLSVTSLTEPAHGTATLAGNAVTYTPNADFNGTDQFTYSARDASTTSSPATVTITVTPVNDAPNAVNDTATTKEDNAVTIAVLANDTDAEGDALSVTSLTQPAHGTAAVAGNAVTYTPNADFNGTDHFTYSARDASATSSSATVTITVTPVNDAPKAVNDAATTKEGNAVTIAVLANDTDVDGDVLSVTSLTEPAHGTATLAGNAVTYTPNADFSGTDQFTYRAQDASATSSPATVTITVTFVNNAPNAVDDTATTSQGHAITIAVLANDTDVEGDALSVTSLTQPANGTAAVAGNAVTYTPNASFSGTDQFTYRARDATANSAPATVTVTVTPNIAPTAVIAGGSRTIPDSDRTAGEDVHLDGSGSTDPDGTIASYRWFDGQQTLIGSAPTIDVRLPDGNNVIRLAVTDNNGGTGSATVTITVAAPPPRTSLQSLPGLTPNQRSVAVALDDLCLRLSQQSALTEGESDLLARCNGIVFDSDPAHQRNAVSELSAQDLNAMKTQTLLLAREMSVGVVDRLMALRSGASGLSAAPGLDLVVNGKTVPPEMLKLAADEVAGGSNENDREPGGFLGERWALWMRGTFGSSGKDASSADQGYDADQWGVTGGIDYRNPEQQGVLGLALGYGKSDASFNPSGEGSSNMSAWSVSLYGGLYPAGGFLYADGFLAYGQTSVDAERRIHYTDAGSTIDRTAQGSTGGSMLSAGVGVGHDFLFGQVTVSPNARLQYLDATVDGFQESGASGLDLVYEKRDFKSATASLGVRITGAVNLGWVVLLPQFRGDALWEFQDGTEVFGVRFANDPFAGTANPTPPILVTSETPDQSYMLLAVGLAAQFRYGISGYVEYQRLEGLEFINADALSVGMRVQYGFR